MLASSAQSKNVPSSMNVTELPMLNSFKVLGLTRPSGIQVKPLPILTDSNRQSRNAQSPMLVTESGIVIFVRLVQLENALLPMLVTESGIVILASSVQSQNV